MVSTNYGKLFIMWVRFFSLILIIVAPSFVFSQSLNQDVVYLKNGGVIKGVILEVIPDSTIKIQTVDKSVWVYHLSDVLKTGKEHIHAEETAIIIDSTYAAPRSALSIFGGAAMPTGDYSKEGNAKSGFMFGAQYVSRGKIRWLLTGSYSSNKMEFPPMYSQNGISSKTGNWTSLFALTGITLDISNPSDVRCSMTPLIGVLFGSIPEITITVSNEAYVEHPSYGILYGNGGGINVSQSSGSSTALAYGVALELVFGSKIVLGARYIASNPEYNVQDKIWGQGMTSYGQIITISQPEQYDFQLKQSTSFILIYLGMVL
jgi:hypothetical protein